MVGNVISKPSANMVGNVIRKPSANMVGNVIRKPSANYHRCKLSANYAANYAVKFTTIKSLSNFNFHISTFPHFHISTFPYFSPHNFISH